MNDIMNTLPGQEATGKELSRRRFLGFAGGLAGAGLLIASCKKEEDPVITDGGTIDLGMNDNGLLNLAFVLQQMEADLYAQIVATPYTDIHPYEKAYFTEMLDQEIIHREFLRNYLKGQGPVVKTDYSHVNFSSKNSVLEFAELLENTVVSALNEICRLLVSGEHVELALKMVSVEARHAATVSNMRSLGNYFGTLDVTGSEQGSLPSNVVVSINRYLETKVSGNNLPNK